jgi:hypothetical protein
MYMKPIIFLFLLFLYTSSWGQERNILDMVSPKLQQFLIGHSAASELLTNVLSEAFSNRTVQLYYFYSNDKSNPRASHYYPDESVVGITIRENQQPSDEFICLIFEAMNSESERSFQELVHKAESGDISRADFARKMLKVEFKAVKRMRGLISNVKLSDKEIADSYYYNRFVECPNKFEDFLTYAKRISPSERDPVKEFEAKYDLLQKSK